MLYMVLYMVLYLVLAHLALLPATETRMTPMLHVAEMKRLPAAAAECTRGRQESIRQHRLAASTLMAVNTLIRTPGRRHLGNTQHLRHLGNTQHTPPHTIPLVCTPRLAMSQGGVMIQEGKGKGVPMKDTTTTGGNETIMV
jgi:hypothetical protein